MKKLICLFSIILLLSGCVFSGKKENLKVNNDNELDDSKNNIGNEIEEEKEPEYVDQNPLKIALYLKQNGFYQRQSVFKSKLESFKDIGLFSIILDDKDTVKGSSINSLYKAYSNNYEDIKKYKIGYQISFTLEDGTKFNETILKPLGVFKHSFSDYLYIWLYDDINNSGHYSHLEPEDYNENTIMSSIKLMSTSLSKKINSSISVLAFTYDGNDDFDLEGNYRGNSKYEMLIERSK